MQESSPYTGEYFGEPVVLIFPCRNLHYSEEYYARRQGAQRDRGTPYPDPRRLGARKSGKDFHPPDDSPPLFAHLSGGPLCGPFGLWGLLAPTPRRKLLKKLEQNFYVLLCPGLVVSLPVDTADQTRLQHPPNSMPMNFPAQAPTPHIPCRPISQAP